MSPPEGRAPRVEPQRSSADSWYDVSRRRVQSAVSSLVGRQANMAVCRRSGRVSDDCGVQLRRPLGQRRHLPKRRTGCLAAVAVCPHQPKPEETSHTERRTGCLAAVAVCPHQPKPEEMSHTERRTGCPTPTMVGPRQPKPVKPSHTRRRTGCPTPTMVGPRQPKPVKPSHTRRRTGCPVADAPEPRWPRPAEVKHDGSRAGAPARAKPARGKCGLPSDRRSATGAVGNPSRTAQSVHFLHATNKNVRRPNVARRCRHRWAAVLSAARLLEEKAAMTVTAGTPTAR